MFSAFSYVCNFGFENELLKAGNDLIGRDQGFFCQAELKKRWVEKQESES